MAGNIIWLGHDTFKITTDSNITIYIDPYQLKERGGADIILITHEHFDHCSPEDIGKIQKDDTVVVTTPDSSEKISGDVRTVIPGDSLTVKDVEVEAVPAYNTEKEFHVRERNWVGFILTVDGKSIYHAGDSDYIPEMKGFKDIDIALLPVSGTYVMNAHEAVQAAIDINPSLAIPMHYGTLVGSESDASDFRDGLKGKVDVELLKPETSLAF